MNEPFAIEYIIRIVPQYGFLPILKVNGNEVYRGEFARTAEQALAFVTKAHAKYTEAIFKNTDII